MTDAEWERLCLLLPSSAGKRGQPWGDHRRIINGILWRTWNGATWRAVPAEYGPWKTCYYRFSLWDDDGTWVKILKALQREADASGDLDWDAQVDATIVRAHQHAAGARKGGSIPSKAAGSRRSGSPGAG